jgi:signal transduction histidine kinase
VRPLRAYRGRGRDVAALKRFAEEQSALRRVATAVARGVSPGMAFRTVASEVGRLFGADHASINRYEPDGTIAIVAQWSDPRVAHLALPLGGRFKLGADSASATVRATGGPARRARHQITGELGHWLATHEIGYVVACPILLHDHLWGTVTALFQGTEPPPADVEKRMAEFVELTGCTIAQAEDRADLIASRSRVVAAFDNARHRFERDLHDGAQQELVSLVLELRMAEAELAGEESPFRECLANAVSRSNTALNQLRTLARGLHPAILSQGGLTLALRKLADRSPVPVHFDFAVPDRLPDQVEITIYYVVSEAVTNVLKHANAFNVHVRLALDGDLVRLSIRDDGTGGADPRRGSGLVGLIDRVGALGGTMTLHSPPGEGTTLVADIPLEAPGHGV